MAERQHIWCAPLLISGSGIGLESSCSLGDYKLLHSPQFSFFLITLVSLKCISYYRHKVLQKNYSTFCESWVTFKKILVIQKKKKGKSPIHGISIPDLNVKHQRTFHWFESKHHCQKKKKKKHTWTHTNSKTILKKMCSLSSCSFSPYQNSEKQKTKR